MRSYKVVDAFSAHPFKGNPVAVVLDADGLSDAEMQAIARWTNLSETTFLLPARAQGADYRLRIFTTRGELPFAGHPTLGSAHAVLEAGRFTPRNGVLVQECAQGLVRISVEGDGEYRRLVLDLPEATAQPIESSDIEELEAILGVPLIRSAAPLIVDVGARWAVVQVANAEVVLGLKPDFTRSAAFERRFGLTGVTVFGTHSRSDAAIEVRSFAPSCGTEEDPVCGSGNGSVAVFRYLNGLLAPEGERYLAGQGQMVGRDGRVAVSVDETGKVKIGGACVTCVDGTLRNC